MIVDYQNQIRNLISALMNDPLFNALLNPLGFCFGIALIGFIVRLVKNIIEDPEEENIDRPVFPVDAIEYTEPEPEPEPIRQPINYHSCEYCGRPYNFTRSTCEGCGAPYKFGQLG